MNHAPDIPNDRFHAMTMLDEKRARSLLAKKAGVEVNEVTTMNIWGNHSSTQYPDVYHAAIAGKPATDVIQDETWLQTEFISTIQGRGAAVIKARGASSAASAANAATSGVYNLVHDTPADEAYSMCISSQGQYGVDEGLVFSYPCRTVNGSLQVVDGIEHNAFGRQKIADTLEELRNERKAVQELGLI